MQIRNLRAFPVELALKFSFSHAHLRRKSTQNIIVETTLESGIKGYGESLPRDYVTGETPEKVLETYSRLNLDDLNRDFSSYEDVVECLRHNGFLKSDARDENAARCALEISVLDAFSKHFNVPLLSFYNGGETIPTDEVLPVSGVISLGRIEKLMGYLSWAKAIGFKQVKVKVSGDAKKDIKRLGLIRTILGPKVDVRVDANMAYTFEEALRFLKDARKMHVTAIEDPLKAQELDRLAELKALTQAEIILDEPICTLQEAKVFLEKSYYDTLNLRISKCGGFLKALEMADFLWEHQKGVQLGCQVGESGILSAAGWHFARVFGALKYYEGCYDSYLLADTIVAEKFKIRKGGIIETDLGPHGLGVTVIEDKIASADLLTA